MRWLRGALMLGCLAAAAPVLGHHPPGGMHYAFEFPPHALPLIDGDLADWALVGADYALVTRDFTDLVRGAQPDEADLAIHLRLAWSHSTNSLYVGARVYDDVHQIDRPPGSAATRIFQDDALEVFVDADHSGGQFADFVELDPEAALKQNGTQASHFVMAGPPPDNDFFVNFSAAAWYALADGPYTEAALQHDPGRKVTTYELRIVPFDLIDVHAVFRSDEHLLQAGEVLGLNVEVNDFDTRSDLYDAKWSLSGGQNAYRLADRFSDLMLVPFEGILPSHVQSVTWGRVKAALRP